MSVDARSLETEEGRRELLRGNGDREPETTAGFAGNRTDRSEARGSDALSADVQDRSAPQPSGHRGGVREGRYTRQLETLNLEITGTRWSSDGPVGFVSVTERRTGRKLHEGELCLTSLRDKESLGRFVAHAIPKPEAFIEIADFFAEVSDGQRQASLPNFLTDIPRRKEAPVIDAGGLPLLRNHPTILFGDGGTFKSMIALHVAGELAREGTKVLFADWELDGPEHRVRLDGLFGTNPPPVRYLHCEAPILAMAQHLRDICAVEAIDYLIVDSVAFATGLPAETSEAAMAYFAALRQIGVGGSLSIAHNTKRVAKSERGREKPFGSVFWHNGARMTWHATEKAGVIELACRKSNLVQAPTSRTVTVRFDRDKIDLNIDKHNVDAAAPVVCEQVSARPSKFRTRDRLDGALRERGPLPKEELRKLFSELSDDAFRMALKRGNYRRLEDGILWHDQRLGPIPQKENVKRRAPEHEHERES